MISLKRISETQWLFGTFCVLFTFGTIIVLGRWCEQSSESSLFTFFLLSSAFSGAALLSVVDYTVMPFEQHSLLNQRRQGSTYLAYAMLVWAAIGLIYLILCVYWANSIWVFKWIEPGFSTINSGFLILGMHDLSFEKEPQWKWPKFVNRLRSPKIVWSIVWIVILLEFAITFKFPEGSKKANYPDFLFSVLTLSYLGVVMFAAFRERHMPRMTWLVLTSLLLTLLGQILKSFELNIDSFVIRYFYISSLQILIFALVISYNYKKSILRAQQNMNDMNHAIRNGLLLLRLEIKKSGSHNSETISRIRSLETLHNLLHEQKKPILGVPLKNYYDKIFNSFLESQNLVSSQFYYKVDLLNSMYSKDIDKIRETGRLIVELNLNALKQTIINSLPILLRNHIYIENDCLFIIVEDSGPGFEYDPDKDYSGFGMKNNKSIVSELNGTIEFKQKLLDGSGTIAKIKIPLKNLNLII